MSSPRRSGDVGSDHRSPLPFPSVAHRKTLNEDQLAVLRWIADGCADRVMDGYSHRVSAAALRRRGLVETSGRGPSWAAKATAAGREYLECSSGANAPVPRQANVSVTEQLVKDVIAAGGSLRRPQKQYYDREGVDYYNRAALAERYGKVPDGKRLEVTAVSPGEVQIDLVDAPEGPGFSPTPVPVPDRVARYHPVVRAFRDRSERHEVSRAALPRVLRLLQGLVADAERRGHDVSIASSVKSDRYRDPSWSGSKQGHIVISADGCSAAVRVTEEGLQSRVHWDKQNRSYSHRLGEMTSRLPPLSEYEAKATGRLTLELVSGYSGRSAKWSDRKSWTLEEKLPELLREVELRAVEERERQRKAEQAAAERERQWSAAMERARELHAEHRRGEILRGEVRAWREAQEISAYCDAAESRYPDDPGTIKWVSWARRYADAIDPLRLPPHVPAAPDSVPPEELRPYLNGWDPYGPSRYRW